ncbi:hypothetical protein PGB90_007006 [Kerria lacca]
MNNLRAEYKGALKAYDTTYHEECLPNFENVPKEEFDAWLTVDDDVPTAGVLTEEVICANIVNRHPLKENEDADCDDADILPSPPTRQKMMRALDVLKRGVQQYGGRLLRSTFNTKVT